MTSNRQALSRRRFLERSALSFGSLAFAAMSAEGSAPGRNPLSPKAPHFAPKARRVIFMWMQGGPSHMDMFDHKARLAAESGNDLPFELPQNKALSIGMQGTRLYGPVSNFCHRGKSGLLITDLLPNLGEKADELCILRGMWADSEAHAPAVRQLHTGHNVMVRPSMGSWVLYGLGTENQNLPGFITIRPDLFGDGGSQMLYSNAFLPAIYQGTPVGEARTEKATQIGYLGNPDLSSKLQRRQLDYLRSVNRRHLERLGEDAYVEGLIESYELAFRMQLEAPEVMDLSKESEATRELYGIGEKESDDFGKQCLMARRLAEAGVRFIQVTSLDWDHHGKIRQGLPRKCKEIDKPISGLLTDLKARGLLEDTLLVWSGEFGRTPYSQDIGGNGKPEDYGREHNPYGFTAWLAGGGDKPGMVYGETDEYGFRAIDGKVHIHDLHATILHLLGLDHERLTYRYHGRDFRLTDVEGNVVRKILA